MKKALTGILLGLCVLTCPVQSDAHERSCPEVIEVTQEEAVELMEIAAAEALGEGTEGMLLVMSTVINRTKSPDFPSTIHDVIYEPHQYYTRGMKAVELTPECHMALALLEMGNLVPEVVAFENKKSNALDTFFDEAFVSGSHRFYTVKHQ